MQKPFDDNNNDTEKLSRKYTERRPEGLSNKNSDLPFVRLGNIGRI